jgi:hypothetical protein
LTNQTNIAISICCGSGKNGKNQILSKNLRTLCKGVPETSKIFFIDQHLKLTNHTKIGAFNSFGVFTKRAF